MAPKNTPMKSHDLHLVLTDAEAWDFAQLVKRLSGHDLGIQSDGLGLVTPSEQAGAESALDKLRRALDDAGFSPR